MYPHCTPILHEYRNNLAAKFSGWVTEHTGHGVPTIIKRYGNGKHYMRREQAGAQNRQPDMEKADKKQKGIFYWFLMNNQVQ